VVKNLSKIIQNADLFPKNARESPKNANMFFPFFWDSPKKSKKVEHLPRAERPAVPAAAPAVGSRGWAMETETEVPGSWSGRGSMVNFVADLC